MSEFALQLKSRQSPAKMHATEMKRFGGSNEHLVGRNKEINASDKADLLRQIGHMFDEMSKGIVMQTNEVSASSAELTKEEKFHELVAAYRDTKSDAFQVIGSEIGQALNEVANRQGFMRMLFQRFDIPVGGEPKIPVNYKTSQAWEASGPAQIQPTFVRNKFLRPPEFYIQHHILIEEKEIASATTDILEQKLLEGQEMIMVREDRTCKKLLDRAVGVKNDLVSIVGSLSPQTLQPLRAALAGNNLPADIMLFASDVWTDMITATNFTQFYDPVSQYELVQTGTIGRLFGMTLISDSYRVPLLRVLQKGEIYVLPRSEYLGGYTDRGPLVANEVNASSAGWGIPARGWHTFETMSMVLGVPAGVVKAIRS